MKSIKLLSLLMAVLMVSCVMVGCGNSSNQEDTTTAPVAPAYAVTVSITVTDMEGNNVIEVADYSYSSGITAPTPYAVVDDYCYMNMENGEGMVKVDEGGRLVSIGKTAAVDGTSYWSVTVNGKDISSVEFSTQELATGDKLVITLKDASKLNN